MNLSWLRRNQDEPRIAEHHIRRGRCMDCGEAHWYEDWLAKNKNGGGWTLEHTHIIHCVCGATIKYHKDGMSVSGNR